MSSSSERMLKLMAYADGELEGAELAEVEAWLAKDAKAVRFANEIANLGDLVNVGHERSEKAKTIASFDIADAVMAGVKPASEAPAGKVSSLDAARARRQDSAKKNAKIGAAVAAALALAASVFLVSRAKEEQPMAQVPAAFVQPAAASSGPGVDVDVDETPGHSVSVFYVPNESMATTTTSVVVWVDESGGE